MLKIIFQKDGFSGFYKGLIPSLLLTTNPMIQYILYEFLKKRFSKDGNMSSASIIWISALSKLITTLFTYPFLSVKTLFQANEKKSHSDVMNLLIKMIKDNGPLYLYKGKFYFILLYFIFYYFTFRFLCENFTDYY